MLQLKDFMPVNFLKKERKLLSSESASGRNRTALTARQRKKSNF